MNPNDREVTPAEKREAQRVRLEQRLITAARDVEEALAEARRAVSYKDRHAAWCSVAVEGSRACEALRIHMEENGLKEKEGE